MALQEEFENQGVWLFRYRGILPLVLLVAGMGLYVYCKFNPETFFLNNTPYIDFYEYFCLAVSLFGLLIRIYTVGHTPENTSGRNVKGQVADSLNTSGIYSIVRHPLYVGNFFMWLGPAMLTGNLFFTIAFILFYYLYYERIMYAEEQFLRRKFGNTYTDWAENVPAFIPSLPHFKKPNLPFSWRKVVKKEKNGLAAIFVIFFLFEVLGESISENYEFNYFYIYACVATLLMYFVLKIIKMKTTWLDEAGR